MTFNQIALKIFKENFRRYLLFFLCGSFAIMIFFMYSTIYTNKELMESIRLSKSFFYAPTLVIVLFCCFFMIYSNNSYIKYRIKEFGLFMILGITKTQIRKIIVIENVLISVLSLFCGLISGTTFSKLFYLLVLKIIGIKGVPFKFTFESYLYTSLFFVAVYCLTTVSSIITTLKYEIVNLLKEYRKGDRNFTYRPVFAIIGIILIVLSILNLYFSSKIDNSVILLRSSLLCLIGLYLSISNMVWFISKASDLFSKNRYKNILFITNLKYSFGQTKNILFVMSLLVAITIFFANISILIISDTERLAIGYNPYHIAYAEIDGKNKISDNVFDNIIKEGKTRLNLKEVLEFVKTSGLIIISDKNLNTIIGSNFHVQEGRFISLVQVMLDDNYPHNDIDIYHMKNIDIQNKNYMSQGEVTKVLFNNINILLSGGTRYVIFNHNDYIDIKSKVSLSQEIGYLNLLNFEDWHKTKEISDMLTVELEKYNTEIDKNTYEKEKMDSQTLNHHLFLYKPASRIAYFIQKKQIGGLALFIFGFIDLLFFIASPVILHFKLLTEFDRERIKYKKLFKLGITGKEVIKLVLKELRVFFFLPFILGTLLAVFFTYTLPAIVGDRSMSIKYSVLIGVIYLFLQLFSYVLYKIIYGRRLLSSLRLTNKNV